MKKKLIRLFIAVGLVLGKVRTKCMYGLIIRRLQNKKRVFYEFRGVGRGFYTSAYTLLYTIYLLDIQWSIIMGVGCRKQRLKNVVNYQRVSICVLPPRYWFW